MYDINEIAHDPRLTHGGFGLMGGDVRLSRRRCLQNRHRVVSRPSARITHLAPPACSPRPVDRLDLGGERKLEVRAERDGALLRVSSPDPDERLELEIRFEKGGPVVRTRAAALDLDSAGDVTARCDSFRVRAESDIDLEAEGRIRCRAGAAASIEASEVTADASPGAVRLRANDDVQLLGELVLLNCDRLPPVPEWVPEAETGDQALPLSQASGDAELIAELERSES